MSAPKPLCLNAGPHLVKWQLAGISKHGEIRDPKGPMSLASYRSLLREIWAFPVGPVRRKLRQNARVLFVLHRNETTPIKLDYLIGNAAAAARVVAWLRTLPEVFLNAAIYPFDPLHVLYISSTKSTPCC
jgi:hypothetical protein